MSPEFVDESLHEVTGDLDGPACTVCGAIMVHYTAIRPLMPENVWTCQSCGETKEA